MVIPMPPWGLGSWLCSEDICEHNLGTCCERFRVFWFFWREISDSLGTINRPYLQFSGLQVFFKVELVILKLETALKWLAGRL